MFSNMPIKTFFSSQYKHSEENLSNDKGNNQNIENLENLPYTLRKHQEGQPSFICLNDNLGIGLELAQTALIGNTDAFKRILTNHLNIWKTK